MTQPEPERNFTYHIGDISEKDVSEAAEALLDWQHTHQEVLAPLKSKRTVVYKEDIGDLPPTPPAVGLFIYKVAYAQAKRAAYGAGKRGDNDLISNIQIRAYEECVRQMVAWDPKRGKITTFMTMVAKTGVSKYFAAQRAQMRQETEENNAEYGRQEYSTERAYMENPESKAEREARVTEALRMVADHREKLMTRRRNVVEMLRIRGRPAPETP